MKKYYFSIILCSLFIGVLRTSAQMVGPDAYIKGNNVEIGIRGAGGFEGVDVTTSPPLAGMHPRSATNLFGFVANPQMNGWATFDGDFFTPGSPENGWGFELGNTGSSAAGTAGSNNCSYLNEIPGSITSFTTIGSCISATWEGNATSGTDLHFTINYFLQTSDLYYTTTVTIKNNTAATIPLLYYYRNVDPDNNEELSFDYTTQNTIVAQPTSGSCNLAHVSATQTNPWNSYMGFAGTGPEFRVSYGGFSNRDASDLWTGTGFTQTVGSTNFADEAIAIAYRVQNLAAGASVTFKYVVILNAASASAAINNLMYLSYPGSLSAPPSACTPYTDTVRACGPTTIAVSGSTVGSFNWSWSPGTGLSTTTGPSTTANPGSAGTYTVTGTPINSCFNTVTYTFVVLPITGGGTPPVINQVSPLCASSPPVTLTADSTGGTWSGTGVTGNTFNPATSGPGTFVITYTLNAGTGCPVQDTMSITVLSAASATINQPATVCAGAPPFNLTAAATGGTWSGTGITNATNGTFDPSVSGAGSFIINYSIGGTCPSSDTVIVTIGSITTPVTGFSYTSPVCTGGTNPTPTPVAGFTTGGTYTSTAGLSINSSTGVINLASSAPGTYTVTYTVAATTCGAGGSSTANITIASAANATITQPALACVTSPAFNLSAATAGGTWSGTGITNSTAGTFNPATSGAGTFTITYSISGTCPSSDTVIVTVANTTTPVTGFSYTTPVCIGGSNPNPTGVAGFTSGGTYSSTAGLSINPTTGVINLGASTAGTYTVTYNVPANGCAVAGSSTTTITINPLTPPNTLFTYNTPVCNNDPNEMPTLDTSFTTGGVFSSTPGLVIDSLTGQVFVGSSTAGTYTVSYTLPQNNVLCVAGATGTATITINPIPIVGVSSDVIMYIGNSATIAATGGGTYSWNPPTDLSCSTCDTTVASPTESTTYCVTVNQNGCVDSSCVRVEIVIPCPSNRNLIVPNAFTPDGDGTNDKLCLYGWDDCVSNFQIMIFDRWGEKVFSSTNASFCWDGTYNGKMLDAGVFVYFIKAEYLMEGDNAAAPRKKFDVNKKGNITLIR